MKRTTPRSCMKPTPHGWIFDTDSVARWWGDAYTDAEGVTRWKSNDRVPFQDMLEDFAEVGLPVNLDLCAQVRDRESAEFLARYRERWQPPTGEALAEQRAEFGEGTVMVDVLAGREYTI